MAKTAVTKKGSDNYVWVLRCDETQKGEQASQVFKLGNADASNRK